jgi:hypothetical protein
VTTHDVSVRANGLDLVREFRVPPEGFSPLSASERELARYGLPPRPDGDKHRGLASLWDEFAGRDLRFVRPRLVPLEDRPRPAIRDLIEPVLTADRAQTLVIERRLQVAEIRLCQFLPLTSTNWSGAVVNRPASEQLVTVTGQWTVPSVSPPASAWNGTAYNDGTYLCAVWVGLDGWGGTTDVLQAGTSSLVTVTRGVVSSPSYYSWIEWFGFPWTPESTFPVTAGDSILCTVCAPFGNTHGTAMFVNQTTGLALNYGIDPPAGVSLSGNVAEWIVEDPLQPSNKLYPFPNYGVTNFQNCHAGSKNISLNLNDACPINLVDGSGNVISESTIESASTLKCDFL